MPKRKFKGQGLVRKHSLSPLKISLFILIGLTATGMIFMSVVVGVMIVDWPEGEPSSRVDDIPEQVVRALLDENGYIVNSNQRTAKITEEHRGGYGGYYFDETDRAVAYAYPFGSRKLYAADNANIAWGSTVRNVAKLSHTLGSTPIVLNTARTSRSPNTGRQ